VAIAPVPRVQDLEHFVAAMRAVAVAHYVTVRLPQRSAAQPSAAQRSTAQHSSPRVLL
jgi:hypothetical protein